MVFKQKRKFTVNHQREKSMPLNFRKRAYFALVELRGQPMGRNYERFLREDREGIPGDTRRKLLINLLDHCKQHVPYYRDIILKQGNDYHADPEAYLKRMPILTKKILREQLEQLKSDDLNKRHWYYTTSGGSTGEPARVIQDYEADAWICAISTLYNRLVGREVGEREVMIWGSMRDIQDGTLGWKARLINGLSNTTFLNSFHMTPDQIRHYIEIINTTHPKLITAYVETLRELARFSEENALPIKTNASIISSAGTLYPFVREKVERVFKTRIYNRYGSRETGDVACERPGRDGLWVAPWGNYVEIVDEQGNPVPDGKEGIILITSLGNHAMPLIRYQIGDRGILSPRRAGASQTEQVLESVTGRTVDLIFNNKGEIIDDGYLLGLFDLKDWIARYQLVQKNVNSLEYRIVRANNNYTQAELADVVKNVRCIMGEDCEVTFNFMDEIPDIGTSGKFRYVVSDVYQQKN
jgi:phenylacetate-CoA ligase